MLNSVLRKHPYRLVSFLNRRRLLQLLQLSYLLCELRILRSLISHSQAIPRNPVPQTGLRLHFPLIPTSNKPRNRSHKLRETPHAVQDMEITLIG
ncbi:hypothetical protein Hanom_Chr16g01494671 [Helianthus anomalus]